MLTFYIRAWNTALRLCCEVLSQGALLLAMGTPATSAWGGFGGSTPEGPQTGQGSSGSNTGKNETGQRRSPLGCHRWELDLPTAQLPMDPPPQDGTPSKFKVQLGVCPPATPRSHVTLAGQLCSPLICIQGKIPQKGKGHTPLITNGCYIGRGGQF